MTKSMLFRIRFQPFDCPPVFTIHRWKIYDAGPATHLPSNEQKYNLNFQAEGNNEKILIRIFISDDNLIRTVKFYYLISTTDHELAEYVSKAVTKRISIKHNLTESNNIISYPL